MRWLVCTASYRWHKRLRWQWSSLLRQVGSHVPHIRYRVHVSPRMDRHIGEWHKIRDSHKSENIELEEVEWKTESFGERYNIRTNDLHAIRNEDWIVWLDPDIVLHDDFCSELSRLMATDLSGCKQVLSVGRWDRDYIDACSKLSRINFANASRYSDNPNPYAIPSVTEILGAYDRANRSTLAAGYFQAVRCEEIRKRGIETYGKAADRNFLPGHLRPKRMYRTFSEKYFRRIFGIRSLRDLPALWHLTHPRRGDIDWDEEACY